MQEVKVKRDDLLVRVRENREIHQDEVAEAITEMVKDVRMWHREQITRIDDGKSFERRANFPLPEDHSDEYDQVIEMLEMSVDDELTLSYHEFQQYVMDKWSWKEAHLQTTAFYSKSL